MAKVKTSGRGGRRRGAGRPPKDGAALTESITVAFTRGTIGEIDAEVGRLQEAAPPGAVVERASWVRSVVIRALRGGGA